MVCGVKDSLVREHQPRQEAEVKLSSGDESQMLRKTPTRKSAEGAGRGRRPSRSGTVEAGVIITVVLRASFSVMVSLAVFTVSVCLAVVVLNVSHCVSRSAARVAPFVSDFFSLVKLVKTWDLWVGLVTGFIFERVVLGRMCPVALRGLGPFYHTLRDFQVSILPNLAPSEFTVSPKLPLIVNLSGFIVNQVREVLRQAN